MEENLITKDRQPIPSGDLIAFARNPSEMQAGQQQLITWAEYKLRQADEHLQHMQANLEQAKSYSWALQGFRAAVNEARKKSEFYEKLCAAFEAGYCVVPDMPIDVFAVRTTRLAPVEKSVVVTNHWNDKNRTQRCTGLALGEGDYVGDQPVVMERKIKTQDPASGKEEAKFQLWSEAFRDVDFPIKTAAIAVLDATGEAMAQRLFDEIGILPERRRPKADPMVIGRVKYKHGSVERSVSFVIAWFLRESDLTI